MEVQTGAAVNAGIESTAARAGPAVLLSRTVAGATSRLVSSPPRGRDRPWSLGMTLLLAASAYSVYLAHFLDVALIAWARESGSPLVPVLAWITPAGKFHWYILPALAVAFASALVDWTERRRRGRALAALLYAQATFAYGALVLAFLANSAAKFVIGRARPVLLAEHGPAHFEPFSAGYAFASFPSGHATACGAVAAILAIWFPRLAIPAAILFGVVAVSRVAVSAHYISDIVAGFCAGFLATLFLARWLGERRLCFRLDPFRLFPRPRHAHAARFVLSR